MVCINGILIPEPIPCNIRRINKIEKEGATNPISVPIKNRSMALSIKFLVLNVSIKNAAIGMRIGVVNILHVVNDCASVELTANSCMIFGKAVMSKNCVKTDKKEADKVIATISRLWKRGRSAGFIKDSSFLMTHHFNSILHLLKHFIHF